MEDGIEKKYEFPFSSLSFRIGNEGFKRVLVTG